MSENKNVVLQNENNEYFDKEIDSLKQTCIKLSQTAHYKDIGYDKIFPILVASKNLNIDPFLALEGGLYYVKGKVEMKAQLMNAIIRKAKHSVTKDKRSDDTICILHGKRSDNGDTWTESFSIKDAEKAGLMKNITWQNYPRDMLFNRALSRLARQLFPDVIGSCYVEGEIKDDPNIPDPKDKQIKTIDLVQVISDEQGELLQNLLQKCPEYCQLLTKFYSKKGVDNLSNIPASDFDAILQRIHKEIEKESQIKKEEEPDLACPQNEILETGEMGEVADE